MCLRIARQEKDMLKKKTKLIGGIGTLALLAAPVASAATFAADSPTIRGYDGPDSCVAIDGNGNVVAPGPGDCAQFGAQGQQRSNANARNVILLIGDGMGQQEITAARNYLKGAGGRFEGLDGLTSSGLYTHHSINKDGTFNYVTDSAASGTAWSTGTKSYNGAIGVDVKGNPQQNMLEIAKNAGMRTGNVSTAEIQDATPAVMGAHATDRSYYAPSGVKAAKGGDLRENGGLGSISEQLVDTRADVTLGGGRMFFKALVGKDSGNTNPFLKGKAKFDTKWKAGKSVLDNAKDNGFQIAETASDLEKITSADQSKPVLGLFSPGNMETTFAPSLAVKGGATLEPQTCKKHDIGTEPELKDMTKKAIELLDKPEAEKGFFLQVESASIDKQDHASDACGQIGETGRLDEATKVALDFAKADGNTLVIVTADHSHTSQVVADGKDTVSYATRLRTVEGSNMAISYGTKPTTASSMQHTGAQLRIAAYGPSEENVIGQTDQTDTFFTMKNALGLGDGEGAANDVVKHPTSAQDVSSTCYKVDSDGKVVAPGPGECSQYGAKGPGRSNQKAKNVIVFIGDGMGDSEITSARDYLYGANGRLPGLDNLQYTGSYTHFSLNPETGKPNYVTDSAASSTGWNTGTKTYNGAIGVNLFGKPVPNIMEHAKARGMKTGNVTTSEIEDATPAGAATHSLNRKCYGPEMAKNKKACQGEEFKKQFRENGGLGSIAEQLVDVRADVTLGGGAKAFEQNVQVSGKFGGDTSWVKGRTVLENAKANGFNVVTDAAGLDSVKKADQDTPVLGLFAEGNMPRHFERSTPTRDGAEREAAYCKVNPERTDKVPSLAAMTTKAMDLLRNDKGFFLQVEGASIDKADHDADACGQIGELDDLDQAISAAQKWVADSGEPTLIVATADHAHTRQITGDGTRTAGLTTKLLTADGAPLVINYANAANNGEDALGGQGHTGAQLRIAASGPGAQNVVGRTDQTDLFYTVMNALPEIKDANPSEPSDEPSDPGTKPSDPDTPSTGKTTQPADPSKGSGNKSTKPSASGVKKKSTSTSSSLARTGVPALAIVLIAGSAVGAGAGVIRYRRTR